MSNISTPPVYSGGDSKCILMGQGGVGSLLALVKSFSPTVLLVGGVGMLQTVGGAPAVLNGDPIGQWLDQSGNNNHAVMATAGKRPTLKLAATNGQPAASFASASSQRMEGPYVNASANQTSFVAFKDTGGANNSRVLTSGTTGTVDNPTGTIFNISLTGTAVEYFTVGGTAVNALVSTLNAYHLSSSSGDGTTITNFLDALNNATANSTLLASTVYDLGASPDDGAGSFLQGEIAFVAMWNTFVSLANQAIIRAAIRATYGTP